VAKTHRMPYLHRSFSAKEPYTYSRVPGDRNWHIETADWNLAGFFTILETCWQAFGAVS